MTSRQRSNTKRNTLIVTGAAVLILITWLRPGIAESIVRPIAIGSVRMVDGLVAASTSLRSYFSSKTDLTRENQVLRDEVATLRAERSWFSALEDQNAALFAIMGRDSATTSSSTTRFRSTSPLVIASVLMRPPRSAFDTILVDAGSADGIVQGNVAISNGVYLGTVVETRETTSVIKLLSSPDSSFSVRVGSFDALAYGLGSGRYKFDLPKDSPVSLGDPVTLSTTNLDLVGLVAAIESPESTAFETIYFTIPVSLDQLQYVELHPPHDIGA